tara:strand:- start:1709 stop:2206 length:498 start_codon:yes stop_codon:yes gene_type:complete
MWIVIKYKKKELGLLKEELKKLIGEIPNLYIPKIKIQKINKKKITFIKQDLLNDYLFCYHKKFIKINSSIFNYLKGVKYCLSNTNGQQKDVMNFINICKKYHDKDNCLKQEFFNYLNINKGIFLTGPLTSMFFELIEKHKNKLKLVVGNINVTISKKSNYLYLPA